MVERVKDPWKTSDGKTFPSRKEAVKHEKEAADQERRAELGAWLGKKCDVDINSLDVVAAVIVAESATVAALLRHPPHRAPHRHWHDLIVAELREHGDQLSTDLKARIQARSAEYRLSRASYHSALAGLAKEGAIEVNDNRVSVKPPAEPKKPAMVAAE